MNSLPVVLIPGHMGTAVSWEYQLQVLGRDRELMVPDQHYSLPSISEMARHIALNLPERLDLVAWSMGGYIAFELLPLIKERIGKVVLISTSARPESPEATCRRNDLLNSVQREGMASVHMRSLNQNLIHPSKVPASFKRKIVSEVVRLGERVLRSQIQAIISRADTRALVPTIQCDALVIGGREDAIAPAIYLEEIADLLPRPSLHILNEAGHCSPWEQPREVNSLITKFLSARST